jgi:hypothetical protein
MKLRFRHRLPVVYSQPNKCHFISSIDKNQVNKSGYSLSNKNQIWSYDYSDGSTDPYENLSMVNEDGESVTKPKVKRNRHLEHLDTEGVIQSIYPLPQSYINNKDFKLNLSPLHSESSLKSSTRSILTFESGSSETHTYRSTPLSVDGVLKGIDDNDYYNTRQYIPIGILSILPSNAEFSITEINGPRLSLHHALGAYAALHEMEISPTPVHLAAKSKETWKEGEAVLTVSVLTFGPLELAVKRDLELIARGREKYQPIMHIDDIRKGYNTIKIFDITRFHEKSLFLSKSVTNEENSDLFDKGMSFSSSPFGAQNGIAKNKLVDDENLFDCKSKNDNPFNHFLPVRPLPRRFLNSASKLCIDNATNDDDSIISTGNVFTLSHLLFSTTLADYMQLAVALDNIYKAKEVTKNSNLGNSSTACYVPSVLAKKVSTFYDKSSWTPHRQHALPHSLQIFTHDAITGVNPLDYKIVLHFLMGYFFGNFVGSGIPSVPFVLPIQFYSSYYTRYHLIPLLEFLIEERGDKEGRDEWINALLVCMYINLIRELKLRTVIQGVKILVEKNQLTKQPVLNLDGLPESYDTITPDDDMFSHQKVSDIPKEKMSLETIPDQVQESKLVSFKGFKQSSVPIQIGSHKHTKIKQKSASIQLKFGATGEKNEKSKYIKEIKGEEESKFEHSVIESNFHPLLTEPSEILFLRLRLLFFLKYSFFFNTQTVYPLFFGKNGEGEVPQVEEIVKPKTDLLNELKNIKTKELQINSNIPIIPREIGNEKGESGGLRKDNETKKRNKNIEDKKVSDNSVIDSNIPVIENSASSDTHALSSFINSLPFNSSANSSDNSDIMLATLLSPLLFYHPYEFVEEKIILLSKMRRHYQALELLIGVVGDLQAAENYVVAFYSGAGEIESRSSSCDSTHIKDKRLNDEKYLHNTMIILMLRFHKTSHIAQYLCKFYRFLSLSLILDSFIPLELPLSSIEPFLVFVFRSLALRRMNSDICLSLLKNETLLKEVL